MQTIHINYPALDSNLLAAPQQPRAVAIKMGLSFAIGLLLLAPLLVWFGWHRQWHALAILGVLLCWVVLLLARSTPRNVTERTLRTMLPLDFTLLPEGLLTVWGEGCYQFRVWALFQTPVVEPLGMTLKNKGDDLYYWILRQAFASDAQYQEFTAQAVAYHAAASPAAAETFPRYREPRSQPHYVLNYQLTSAEESTITAKNELEKRSPQTLPAGEVTPQWKAWLFGLAFLGTFLALLYDLHDDAARSYKYSPLTFIALALNLVYFWFMLKLAVRFFPNWIRMREPSLAHKQITLNDQGLREEQPGLESETPWPSIDALIHHEGKTTLWHAGIIQAVIPDRVFQSPDEAKVCVEWMRERIGNPSNLPTAQAAEKFPVIDRPDTDNPYQAPRY